MSKKLAAKSLARQCDLLAIFSMKISYYLDFVIGFNSRQPLFARNGLGNPYLNYHAKILQKRKLKKEQEQNSKLSEEKNADEDVCVKNPYGKMPIIIKCP